MRARSINENQNFERGQSPKDSMGIGMGDKFQVLSIDAQDSVMDDIEDKDVTNDVLFKQFDVPVSYSKAKKAYDEIKGSVSNVYLVQIIEQEEYI